MLLDKLKMIVKYKVEPDDVYILIDDKPVIDTLNEIERQAATAADIIINQKYNINYDDFKRAERIIYWKAGEDKNAVFIVGIAWMPGNNIQPFEGRVLAPRIN
jgi:hypothetical protein